MQTLYLICGIPMSGKTSVAYELAAENDAVVLSSQEIWEEFFRSDTRSANKKEVFRLLRERLEKQLALGRNAIIDSANPLPGNGAPNDHGPPGQSCSCLAPAPCLGGRNSRRFTGDSR